MGVFFGLKKLIKKKKKILLDCKNYVKFAKLL